MEAQRIAGSSFEIDYYYHSTETASLYNTISNSQIEILTNIYARYFQVHTFPFTRKRYFNAWLLCRTFNVSNAIFFCVQLGAQKTKTYATFREVENGLYGPEACMQYVFFSLFHYNSICHEDMRINTIDT